MQLFVKTFAQQDHHFRCQSHRTASQREKQIRAAGQKETGGSQAAYLSAAKVVTIHRVRFGVGWDLWLQEDDYLEARLRLRLLKMALGELSTESLACSEAHASSSQPTFVEEPNL